MPEPRKLVHLLVEANKKRQQEDYRAALRLYLRAHELYGENADLLATIASSYSDLAYNNPHETGENHQEAVAWMEKAVALAPGDARMHAALASFCELGIVDYERAAQEYRIAIELNPNDVWALSSASGLYGAPENVVTRDEAITWLERTIQFEPNDPNHHFRLGRLYHEANRLQDAERAWIKSLLCHRPLDPGPTQRIESSLGTD